MFSSNPLPHLPSHTNVFPPPNLQFVPEEVDVPLNYYQRNNDPFIWDGNFFHAYNSAPPPIMDDATTVKQDFVRQRQQQVSEGSGSPYCEVHDELFDLVISGSKNKAVASKKDGHSKICTARGPRDRRVRLSVDVAKKFFCLQDLLGFDKPSKTLDWLLTSSLGSIKKLIGETNHSSSSIATSQSKLKVLETIKGGSDEKNGQRRKSVLKRGDGKRKKTTSRCDAGFGSNSARNQSRAEARARARERTRQKKLVTKFNDDLKTCQVSSSNLSLKSSCGG